MNWATTVLLLLVPFITTRSFAQETETPETTTLESNNVSNEVTSSSESPAQLDSNLRSALLKALSDLETDSEQELEDEEKTVEKAQARAVTYHINDEPEETVAIQNQLQQDETKSLENQITTTVHESTKNFPSNSEAEESSFETSENTSTEKPNEVLVQKSDSIQSIQIAAVEKEPLDFFKDAEQIITSASNSFTNQKSQHSNQTPRSIQNEESESKTSGFLKLNDFKDFESKVPIEEAPFVKTYIRPLGNIVSDDVANVKSAETYVKSANVEVNSKNSVTSAIKNTVIEESDVKSIGNGANKEATTEAAVEVSTEESEAKVEQVQFFTAPLVAAFTVHQDEKGQPKKVEPIFKNEIVLKKEQPTTQQNILQQNTNLQSSSFNDRDFQNKQQLLVQELENLRKQQFLQRQNILLRNSVGGNQVSNNAVFTQSGFNQAIKQNFNQFDPIFTEPDRSIVTKLATIDPTTLLSQNGDPVLNKFKPSEATFSIANSGKPNVVSKNVPDSQPTLQNINSKGEVSLVPSISIDPIIQGGKLPLNAQILPNKEPTGFFNFIPLPDTQNLPPTPRQNNQQVSSNLIQTNSNFLKPSSNFNDFSNSLVQSQQSQNFAQPSQTFFHPSSNLIQPSISNFASSSVQGNGQIVQNANFLGNQGSSNLANGLGVANFQNINQNNDFLTSNRILRQEQGIANLGINQNSVSIIKAREPFSPIEEIGYFPENNKILRQNQIQPNFVGQNNPSLGFQGAQNNFFSGNRQNQNRFFKANLESSVTNPNSFALQNSIQPFGSQILNNNHQNNRLFRSNPEGSLSAPQNFDNNRFNTGFSQSTTDYNNRFLRSNQEGTILNDHNNFLRNPTLQTYKYSNSFGFPTIPLNKK